MKLVLLTTPIGNIGDASTRLRDSLNQGGLYFAEDTRQFHHLVELLQIRSPQQRVIIFNDHKQDRIDYYLDLIRQEKQAYLLSDAGSPVLSDPAYPLVRAVINAGGSIESIPGPSAVTTALEVSGLPPIPYMFHGFLPRKKIELENAFFHLEQKVTHCFFESPKRIVETLRTVGKCLPNSDIVVVRELTKKHEEHYRCRGHQAASLCDRITTKGEFVLLVHTEETRQDKEKVDLKAMAELYLERPTPKGLAKILAKILDQKNSDIYETLNKK